MDDNLPPRVFVVNEPLTKVVNPDTLEVTWERMRDLSPALHYGDFVHVFPAGKLPKEPGYYMRTAREKLKDFRGCDYLLLAGSLLAIMAAGLVASQNLGEDESHLNLLIWDGKTSRYHNVALDAWPPSEAEGSFTDYVTQTRI